MIHFDISHSELLLALKDKLTHEEGFAYNKNNVGRHRLLWEAAQPHNKWPVRVSLGNPLWDEHPPTPPSTNTKTDNN